MDNKTRYIKLGKDVNKIYGELTSKYENDVSMTNEEKLSLYTAMVQKHILKQQKNSLDKIIAHISDSVAIFIATSGDIQEAAKEARLKNDLFLAYAIEAFSLAIVEAAAECIHDIIRTLWGLDDKTRGVRLAPGYSCCPDLKIQKDIFNLLKPESINIQLTGDMMMEPEASISAIVFHQPDGRHY